MNIQLTTQAAEGLPRRRFTVEECFRLTEEGFFQPDEKYELIGGEIVPVQAKNFIHSSIQSFTTRKLNLRLGDEFWVFVEPTVHLSEDTFIEPDIVVTRRDPAMEKITGAEVLLAIEVANTTFVFDMGKKAQVCAVAQIPDYWVINTKTLETHIHRAPKDGAYGDITQHGCEATLQPLLLEAINFTLAEMK